MSINYPILFYLLSCTEKYIYNLKNIYSSVEFLGRHKAVGEKIKTSVGINKELDPSDDSIKRSKFHETRYFSNLRVEHTFAGDFFVFRSSF